VAFRAPLFPAPDEFLNGIPRPGRRRCPFMKIPPNAYSTWTTAVAHGQRDRCWRNRALLGAYEEGIRRGGREGSWWAELCPAERRARTSFPKRAASGLLHEQQQLQVVARPHSQLAPRRWCWSAERRRHGCCSRARRPLGSALQKRDERAPRTFCRSRDGPKPSQPNRTASRTPSRRLAGQSGRPARRS
jgi:hypothetical protein